MKLISIFISVALTCIGYPRPSLSGHYTDHMVLQRDQPIKISGTTQIGYPVSASLRSADTLIEGSVTVSLDGSFTIDFAAQSAGGPYTLTVSDPEGQILLTDILIGDIWLCSGQSNMEWPLEATHESQVEIARAHHPAIRLFTIKNAHADKPLDELRSGEWLECEPDTAATFSAVAYYFGKEISTRTGVPIGLIDSTWGGTQIQLWTPRESYERDPRFAYLLEPTDDPKNEYNEAALANDTIERVDELLKKSYKWDPQKPLTYNSRRIETPNRSAALYNAMIHPLTKRPIKGVIWYQGENNVSRATEYRSLFTLMINAWREQWQQPELPFIFVQLANFGQPVDLPQESEWAELREAQSASLKLPDTAQAITIDIGEADNIHPSNKKEVGRRLALQALPLYTYIHISDTTGPKLKNIRPAGRDLVLEFDNTGGALTLKGPKEKAFAIANEKGPFHWAHTRLERDKIILSSTAVSSPTQVRYAWADNPQSPLFNESGFPAAPFRTDRRPLSTEGRLSAEVTQFKNIRCLEQIPQQVEWVKTDCASYAVSSFRSDSPHTNLIDKDPTTRWSAHGNGVQIIAKMNNAQPCSRIGLRFHRGNRRQYPIKIEHSVDAKNWTESFFGLSSGESDEEESFDLSRDNARFVLITFFGNTDNLENSLTEISFKN